MKKIKAAIFGTGFMGRVHTEGVRRLGNVEVAGIAARTREQALALADELSIERASGDYREFLADPEIDAVHICTPNSLHFSMATDALRAGKHVLCEKPLATSTEDAREMVRLAAEKNLANCTFHNLRYYPQVQNMRRICEAGELGEVLAVQGTYSQDWLLYNTDWNWRIETGPSRAFADIGTHWCDMVEHVTGLRISAALCADLCDFPPDTPQTQRLRRNILRKNRRPRGLHRSPDRYRRLRRDDLPPWRSRPRRHDRQSDPPPPPPPPPPTAGRKNRLFLEIYGTKSSLVWDGEQPDQLWIGQRNSPNGLIVKDPSLLHEKARSYADLPGGHSEGYDDTFKQVFRRFYRTVADRSAPVEYPTFLDGLRQMEILDAVLESSRIQAWVKFGL